MVGLIDPLEFRATDMQGTERVYLLSKIPASYSKEIVLQYPTSALPKIGDPNLHMKITFMLMSYVAVPRDKAEPLRLSTRELCDNHIPDLRTWMAIEKAMAQYNWDFFLPEDLSLFWERIRNMLVMWSQEISTDSSQQSSHPGEQASTS